MYTIDDYNTQVQSVKNELDTLDDIVSDFIERWNTIQSNIEELTESIENMEE